MQKSWNEPRRQRDKETEERERERGKKQEMDELDVVVAVDDSIQP